MVETPRLAGEVQFRDMVDMIGDGENGNLYDMATMSGFRFPASLG
jgi:hypothetical protein